MQSRGKMTDRELSGIINTQIEDAVAYDSGEMSKLRQKALQYYEGHETLGGDVPAQKGRSSVVSRDVSDTHGWVMPQMQRIFTGGERTVVYEPRRREAEEGASQATDYVNYLFRSECDGYSVLYDAFWDGLALGNGIIKHWWDSTPAYCTETLSGIAEARYIDTVNDPNVEVLEHTERDDPNYTNVADPGGMDGPLGGNAGGAAALGGESGDGAPAAAAGALGGGPGQPLPNPSESPGGFNGDADRYGVPSIAGDAAGGMAGAAPPAAAQPPGFAGLAPPKLHDLKIKRKRYDGRVRIAAVPHEEFRIDRNALKLDEEHVLFCAHVSHNRTRGSLIQDYPDQRTAIEDLPAYIAGGDDKGARAARGMSGGSNASPDHSTDLIEVWECYVQIDFNSDGVPEWRQVIMAAGNQTGVEGHMMLANEEWGDPLPFSDVVPDPMPHRWRGGSLYDDLADIQQIKTVFLRGFADNLYWANNPQREVVISAVDPASMEELYNPTYGGNVFVKQAGVVNTLPVPFIADKLTVGLDWFDKIREFRTGVSAATAGLDPETLQNQTAMAASLASAASHAKNELRARNCAEGGIKRMFGCLLKLITQHQDKTRTIKLRGEWVDMNPNSWDADMNVIVNVGLGSGSREHDVAILQAISLEQKAIIQGLTPMVAAQFGMGPDVVFATDRKMVEAAGLKSPETYFPEISKDDVQQLMQQMLQQQQQAPDPKMAESQAKIQVMQQEAQAKAQADQQRMATEQQAKQQQAALDWQHKQQQSEIDNQHREREIQMKGAAMVQELNMKHQLALEQAQRDFALKQQEMQAGSELKLRELQMEAELKREEMKMRPQQEPNIQQAET